MCLYVLRPQVDEDVIKDCIPLVEVDHTRVYGINSEDQVIESLTGHGAREGGDLISAPKKATLSKTASVRLSVSKSASKLPTIEDESSFAMEIHTRLEGYNSGKTYHLLHTDKDLLATWSEKIAELSLICKKEEAAMAMSSFERIQQRIAIVYKVTFCLQSQRPIAFAENKILN
jgi:hypothetical protein